MNIIEKSRFFSFIVKDENVYYIDNDQITYFKNKIEKENLELKLKSVLEGKPFVKKKIDDDEEYIKVLEKGYMYKLVF
jgi:hypothetical protein